MSSVVLNGMTIVEGLRTIGGYPEALLKLVAASHPGPLVTGAVLTLRR